MVLTCCSYALLTVDNPGGKCIRRSGRRRYSPDSRGGGFRVSAIRNKGGGEGAAGGLAKCYTS